MKLQLCSMMSLIGLVVQGIAAEKPEPFVTGMKNPESVCLGKDGRTYVTEIGEFDMSGDGIVSVIVDGKAKPFATGLDDPKGIVLYQNSLYLTDKTRVMTVDEAGTVTTFVPADKFPIPPLFLNDITVEPESGTIFVSDSGDLKGMGGAIFKIDAKLGTTELFIDAKSLPGLHTPNGLVMDGKSHLMLVDFGTGVLYCIKLSDKAVEKVADGFDGGDGLAWDKAGRLFITSWKTGKVFCRQGNKVHLVTDKFEQAADCCLDATGRFLLVPDMKAGTLTALDVGTTF